VAAGILHIGGPKGQIIPQQLHDCLGHGDGHDLGIFHAGGG